MDEQKELISLGHEADMFLSSKLGTYVKERAAIEIEQATAKLVSVDCNDVIKIRNLQTIVRMNQAFLQWLGDASFAGKVAYSEYLDAVE